MVLEVRSKFLGAVLGATAALGALAGSGTARADVHWLVSGVFDDGGTLSGSFSLNQYGFLSAWDLTTTPGLLLGGYEYKSGTSTVADPTSFSISFATLANKGGFDLVFANDLTSQTAFDPLVLGGLSSECDVNSYCPNAPVTRELVSGAAYVPEPATWLLMTIGMGAVGGMARRRRPSTLQAETAFAV